VNKTAASAAQLAKCILLYASACTEWMERRTFLKLQLQNFQSKNAT